MAILLSLSNLVIIKVMRKSLILTLCLVAVFILILTNQAQAGTKLIKSANSDTVYYVDDDNIRHAFPNRVTYESWFGDDFSRVENISAAELADIPLGGNVVLRPGKFLVKVPSSPDVYAVEPGGVLRHLTTAGLAKDIYGSSWQLKLRDLPEVFFENYSLGKPISLTRQIPNGHVYQIVGEDEYYWKNKGILEPFKDWSDVLANGYDKFDVIIDDHVFFQKIKPIQGLSDRVFNLILPTNESTATCQTEELKAAVIFVTNDKLDPQELTVTQAVVDNLQSAWHDATDGLSNMNVSADFTLVTDKDSFFVKTDDEDNLTFNLEELSLQFYETQPDEYDFLIVFNDFLPAANPKEKASYSIVRNDYLGTNRITLQRENWYGSLGRLKGVVNMNTIDQYSVGSREALVSLLDLIHHELLHHWAASVSFINEQGERDWSLLDDDKFHWTKWLDFISPLGGWGWSAFVPTQVGTTADEPSQLFVSGLVTRDANEITKFSQLDLYLMGLMPARYIEPVKVLIPDEPNSVSDEVIGSFQEVSINQIIESHGPWSCLVD